MSHSTQTVLLLRCEGVVCRVLLLTRCFRCSPQYSNIPSYQPVSQSNTARMLEVSIRVLPTLHPCKDNKLQLIFSIVAAATLIWLYWYLLFRTNGPYGVAIFDITVNVLIGASLLCALCTNTGRSDAMAINLGLSSSSSGDAVVNLALLVPVGPGTALFVVGYDSLWWPWA